jgi:O-antigen/teichoic acid export membrane protein
LKTSPLASLMRIFGSSVADQAMLSGANLLIGLILIRYASDTQYGYYVLAFNAMMLATTLQGTFINTPLVAMLPTMDDRTRSQWLGSLLHDQRRWAAGAAIVAIVATGIALFTGALPAEAGPICAAAIVLILAALYREYYRGILIMLRRPHPVLGADAVYVVGLIAGGLLAAQSPWAATVALLAAAISAVIGGTLLRRVLGETVDHSAAPGRLRDIARTGIWAAAGGVIYWLFNQGYSFLTVLTLDVNAVAAVAAARLLLMPVNLLVTGVQKQLMPMASSWLHEHGARTALKRLSAFSLALGLGAAVYVAIAWVLRDWIFVDLMHKDFANRDTLLALWSAIFLIMALREPAMLVSVLRQRFRILAATAGVCSVFALAISYVCMQAYGAVGAPLGILAGEVAYFFIAIALALVEVRRDARTASTSVPAAPRSALPGNDSP